MCVSLCVFSFAHQKCCSHCEDIIKRIICPRVTCYLFLERGLQPLSSRDDYCRNINVDIRIRNILATIITVVVYWYTVFCRPLSIAGAGHPTPSLYLHNIMIFISKTQNKSLPNLFIVFLTYYICFWAGSAFFFNRFLRVTFS